MKAIIPVAGAGTKLRPHTYTQPKALIPLAGKTILSVNIDQLYAAGIHEFVFIIGYLGEKIQDYVRERYPQIQSHFIFQNERKGTAHAVNLTRSIIGDDEVFITLGDTICEYDLRAVLSSEHSMLGVKRVDDPRTFGVAEVNEEDMITRVVEKPSIPKSNLALVGLYKIRDSQRLFACLNTIIKEGIMSHDEFNLTDALQCMIQAGTHFKAFRVENWFDCGRKESLLESNSTLLQKFGGTISDSSKFENSIFIPPVSVSEHCDIKNSIIGPHVTIGENTVIHSSIIKDSIIGSFSKLYDVVLDTSLIGSDTEIIGETRSLNVGDNTQIDLG
ncbi:MAG TPA: sugar phosphate nucleotidyltransferase [Ginsengibacter sp.]|nr:NTP transferase domain-containing protein [Chitinophagaceae bacterium]MCZ2396364.1 NTP transferase domain-containing protein [Chitinophagales bacterium]HRN73278.1 sugar phosphate nucleotidyltransferase [Ginsengibacter sp.]MCO5287144.1 sugar phosphate nucleotidyltransferase [Chitinophagaceae bacterium]MCW5915301.1 NTP transferase domain-containing protein [Chitinophagaceae bacterium]